MIFNSLSYLLLLALVVALYWNLPYRARLLLIFGSSLVFYGFWRVEFLPLLLLSTTIDYVVARTMEGRPDRQRKRLLLVSLVSNLGLLIYFKYLIFIAENVTGFAHLLGFEPDPVVLTIILPLGISFYTFQTISYTIDVYRGFIRPEKDFIAYGCYVTFFPQLIAGPVLRAAEVLYQFKDRVPFSWEDVFSGLRRVLYGLLLKVVVADNIAPLVDSGYATPAESLSALDVHTLAFLFGFQIYFDFSAYSHIAIGSARMIGIRFPENFNFPYLANSPRDFWRRWHISLSSWIRDYLYLPLAGIKVQDRSVGGLATATTDRQNNRALFASWCIMGLWHGANWTFLLWGIYHAVAILCYRMLAPLIRFVPRALQWVVGVAITLPVMMLGWIPFRAESVHDALLMWGRLFDPSAYLWLGLRENVYLVTALLTLLVIMMFAVHHWVIPRLSRLPAVLAIGDMASVAVTTFLALVFLQATNQFIYFQF